MSYQGNPALVDVNLDIEDGEFLGLIGPNGGGKTTLLRVVLGLLKPDTGTVEVLGMRPDRLARKRHVIGYIPQYSFLDLDFPASVLDVVLMARYGRIGLFRRPSSEDRMAATDALGMVEMGEFVHRQIGQLSGGQRQRVFIARALASQPRLLILDEPLVGVDARGEGEFYSLLEDLRKRLKLTVVIVSHDVGVVSSYVDKVACLNKTLYLHDTPDKMFSNKTLEKVYGCEIELVAHGKYPHRVLEEHS